MGGRPNTGDADRRPARTRRDSVRPAPGSPRRGPMPAALEIDHAGRRLAVRGLRVRLAIRFGPLPDGGSELAGRGSQLAGRGGELAGPGPIGGRGRAGRLLDRGPRPLTPLAAVPVTLLHGLHELRDDQGEEDAEN